VTAARAAAGVGSGLLALSIVLLPWYALGDYVPNGWDATAWLRAALVLAALNLVAVRGGGTGSAALAVAALVLVAGRVALPPDFGFDFDGLDVPVERRAGAWIGLTAAVVALAAALAGRPRPPRSAAADRAGGW
jgi:hypothetical protein